MVMSLLGEPSFVSSHRFRFAFVRPALEFQMTLLSDADMEERDDIKWSHPTTSGEPSCGSVICTPSQEEAVAEVRGMWIYTDHDGMIITLSQHDHYLNRCRDRDAVIPGVGEPTLEW